MELQHLPDDVLLRIQARAPRSCHPVMKLVSKSWNSTMSSDELFTLRRDLRVTEQWLYILLADKDSKFFWYSLDPHGVWRQLPDVNSGYSGCSVAEVSGLLYVIGGQYSTESRSVLLYDPRSNVWSTVSPMSTRRGQCETGAINGLLYVVGGAGSNKWSGEVYEPVADKWKSIADMPATSLWGCTAGMVVLADRLFVVQDMTMLRGGKVYEPVTGTWSDMPCGMLGEKDWCNRVAVVEGRLLSLNSGTACTLREYDVEQDCWRVVASTEVPVDVDLSWCRLVSWNGRPHVVGKSSEDGNVIVVLRVEICGGGLEFTVVGSRRFGSVSRVMACQAVGI